MGQLGAYVLKTYILFFVICCNAFQSMAYEERIGEKCMVSFTTQFCTFYHGDKEDLWECTQVWLNVVIRATENVLSLEQPNGKPLT
jgi:hypothetical protein